MALRCVTSLTAILAPHCAGNLYFYLWRTAGLFFFSAFFLSLCLSPPVPSVFNTQDALPFFDLNSVELLQTGTYRVDGTGGQTLYRERVSVGCLLQESGCVRLSDKDISMKIRGESYKVLSFCVLFGCFASSCGVLVLTAWAARTIQSTNL